MTEMSTNHRMNKPIIVYLYNIIPHNEENNKLLLSTCGFISKNTILIKEAIPAPQNTHCVISFK